MTTTLASAPRSPFHKTWGLGGGLPDLTHLRAPPGLSVGAADDVDDDDDVAAHVDAVEGGEPEDNCMLIRRRTMLQKTVVER